jgi:hypothetical protein
MVYVYINSDRSSPALESEGRSGLEDDIDEFLGADGQVSGGGAGMGSWNVDLELSAEGDWEARVERLAQFLRSWGVPEDTELVILPPGWEPGMESRRISLFPDSSRASPS